MAVHKGRQGGRRDGDPIMLRQERAGIREGSVSIFVGVERQNVGGSFFGESVCRFPATVAMDTSRFAI